MKKNIGARNKRMGADFERRVRKDLESKGWIVSKWQNNVEFSFEFPPEPNGKTFEELEDNFLRGEIFKPTKGKCVPAKPGKFRMMQTGFPDFIAYQMYDEEENFLDTGAIPKTKPIKMYKVIFVECKTNGYLSKEEKEKAQWYIKNNYCEEFWIAYKTKEKNRVLVNYKKLE